SDGCSLTRRMAGAGESDVAVREEVAEVLVVRPRHEVVAVPSHDLARRGDRRQELAPDRGLLGVVPDDPRRLREAPEVVGADVVLVHLGLALARRGRLEGLAEVGPGKKPANDVEAPGPPDFLERAPRFR